MSPAQFERARPTFLENWPDPLRAMSIAQVDIPLSLDEARALGTNIRHFSRWFGDGPPQPLSGLTSQLDLALQQFPNGAFVRLGSRSGKDSDFALASGKRIHSARGAMLMLTDGSERIARDLRAAISRRYEPHVFVRKWHDIPPWAEFRCFMQQRRLVGISQYDCINCGSHPEIQMNEAVIREGIEGFFQVFRERCHLDDVVFDLFVCLPENGADRKAITTLLELNPLARETDSVLFNWSCDGDFDGSFRYLP